MSLSPNTDPASNSFLEEDEDDDLFVSAIQTAPKSNLTSEMEDDKTLQSPDAAIGSDLGDEIDLNGPDEDILPEDPSPDQPAQLTTENIPAKMEPEKPKVVDPPVTIKPVPQAVTVLKSTPLSESGSGDAPQQFIEIKVDHPKKVGDGYSSYVVYQVTTKTNLSFFRRNSLSVNRRFSDFRGLRDKLVQKHLHTGRIIPPAPEKDAVATAKVKMSKDDDFASDEFIERRRLSLERFLNRTAAHPVLRADPDFREFLELDTELPKVASVSSISPANWFKKIGTLGENINKMTFRMDESDPWYEEKQQQVENLDVQLRKLQASVDALIHHRKELTSCTGAFAKSCAILGNCEEHTSLSCALSQLADTEEKVEQVYQKQVNSDFVYMAELLKDYIGLIKAVKDVFHQRVKVYQIWQNAQQQLTSKREQKAKMELAGRTDKVAQANEEVTEWEAKVNRGQEEFEAISKTIKSEVESFELQRISDFKASLIKYMESLLETQEQLIKHWEAFLPDAKAIS